MAAISLRTNYTTPYCRRRRLSRRRLRSCLRKRVTQKEFQKELHPTELQLQQEENAQSETQQWRTSGLIGNTASCILGSSRRQEDKLACWSFRSCKMNGFLYYVSLGWSRIFWIIYRKCYLSNKFCFQVAILYLYMYIDW